MLFIIIKLTLIVNTCGHKFFLLLTKTLELTHLFAILLRFVP